MAGNLNIVTFIKDIYQSLKNIDVNINLFSTGIDARLKYLEDNQKIILDKLNNLEQMISKIDDNMKYNNVLDKTMEIELMKKMNILNKDCCILEDKQKLKYEELTFANILENNYTILDINNSLADNTIEENYNNTNIIKEESNESINDLLF